MAKRSYRGKHPYNDTKAETASSTKYSSKIKRPSFFNIISMPFMTSTISSICAKE